MSAKKVVLKRLKSSMQDSNTPNLLTLIWKKDSNNVIKFHFPMELAYLPNEMAAKERLRMLKTITSIIGESPENIEIESEFRVSENRPKVIDYLLKYGDFISAITDQEDKEGLDLTRNPHLNIQEVNLGSFNDKSLESNRLGIKFIIQKKAPAFLLRKTNSRIGLECLTLKHM